MAVALGLVGDDPDAVAGDRQVVPVEASLDVDRGLVRPAPACEAVVGERVSVDADLSAREPGIAVVADDAVVDADRAAEPLDPVAVGAAVLNRQADEIEAGRAVDRDHVPELVGAVAVEDGRRRACPLEGDRILVVDGRVVVDVCVEVHAADRVPDVVDAGREHDRVVARQAGRGVDRLLQLQRRRDEVRVRARRAGEASVEEQRDQREQQRVRGSLPGDGHGLFLLVGRSRLRVPPGHRISGKATSAAPCAKVEVSPQFAPRLPRFDRVRSPAGVGGAWPG